MIFITYQNFTPKISYRQGQFSFATVTKVLINYTNSDIIFPQKSQLVLFLQHSIRHFPILSRADVSIKYNVSKDIL